MTMISDEQAEDLKTFEERLLDYLKIFAINHVMRLFLLTGFTLLLHTCSTSKILYIFPVGCKSSFLFHQKMAKILVNRGHQVLVISKFPQKESTPNYTDIDVSNELYSMADAISIQNNPLGTYANLYVPYQKQLENCERLYPNEKIKQLMTEKFDLVLLEIAATKCFVPFAFSFKVPVVGVVAGATIFTDFDGFIGNPGNPSYVPFIMGKSSSNMNFFQRFSNTFDFFLHYGFRQYYTYKGNQIARKYIPNTLSIEELFANVSLIFYNSHSTYIPQALAPNTIEVAGIHIEEPSPLPSEIRKFIDTAKNGVIFVSLGSVVKVSSFPKELHDTFLNVFAKLPYHIIWRHNEPEYIENVPKNVLVHRWLPQIDILAEKKLVLFISHCGVFSALEAINFGVPVLGIPVLYDQFSNAAIVEDLGIGLQMNYESLTEDSLLNLILQLLNEKKYTDNVQKLSAKFKSRSVPPSEMFAYWIDYVLQFKDLSHLKPSSMKLYFFQYFLLDITLFILLFLYVIYRIGYIFMNILSKPYVSAQKPKQKRK